MVCSCYQLEYRSPKLENTLRSQDHLAGMTDKGETKMVGQLLEFSQ